MKERISTRRFTVIVILVLCAGHVVMSQERLAAGSVIISHMSPEYDRATDEFVVLFNAGGDSADLQGYELRYFTASGSAGNAGKVFSGQHMIPPGRHLLLSTNDSVFIGTAGVLSDDIFSGGMASSGGQLVLRESQFPDSILFALAWGSVSSYVAGMSDAAPWNGDGMIALLWTDSSYGRSTFNFSNGEFRHISADSVSTLPSMAGRISETGILPWSIRLVVSHDGQVDSSVVVGVAQEATDGFDPVYDLPKPPAPPGNTLSVGIYRPDLGLPTGSYLSRDIRQECSLADTTARWFMDVSPLTPASTISLSADLTGVPPHLPIQIRHLGSAERWVRQGGTVSTGPIPVSSESHRFLIVIGDTTPPKVQFSKPSADTVYVVSSIQPIVVHASDASGIESVSATFEDLMRGSSASILDTSDIPDLIEWRLPKRQLTDSATLSIFLRDSMGNETTYTSPMIRIVPDTGRVHLSTGWHAFGIPLDPVGRDLDEMMSSLRADSVYVFEYRGTPGYTQATDVRPGHGYFIGLLGEKELILPGIPAEDSLWLPAAIGFTFIANPTSIAIALEDLLFESDGTIYSYRAALDDTIIGGGFYGYDHQSGLYQESDSLRPWEGYWLPVLAENVSVGYGARTEPIPMRVRSRDDRGWSVRIHASAEGVEDSLFSFGADVGATEGFDGRFDIAAPPAPPASQMLSVYAHHPEWNTVVGDRFLRDIRAGEKAGAWQFHVQSDMSAEVRLGSSMGSIPIGLRIRSVTGDGPWMDLVPSWSYETDAGAHLFAVMSAVTDVGVNDHVPRSFRVWQNFPNPFNGRTEVLVDIPAAGLMIVHVYDLQGRRVDTVFEGVVGEGTSMVSWKADISSGVYLGEVVFRPEQGLRETIRRFWRMILIQ